MVEHKLERNKSKITRETGTPAAENEETTMNDETRADLSSTLTKAIAYDWHKHRMSKL